MRFVKGHGTGNDFVLIPDAAGTGAVSAELAVALCDRRTGLGADGVLRVAPADGGDGWFMDHRNSDGSTAEMCGNGIRVFARYLVDSGLAEPGTHSILTRSGRRVVDVPSAGDISVDMGVPVCDGVPREVTIHGQPPAPGTSVDMGNPHVVVLARGELAELDLTVAPVAGPGFPQGVNVEVITVTGPHSLAMRVHERGAGETRSCGTGACAAAVAAARLAGIEGDWEWQVRVPGGELSIRSADGRLIMTGAAVIVAEGMVDVTALNVGMPGSVLAVQA